MTALRLCGVAILAVICASVIRPIASGILPSARVATGIVLAISLLGLAGPAVEYVTALSGAVGFEKYAAPILKGCGIAALSHGCATLCRDSGEGGMAEYVELAGRLEILLLCLPLMEEVLSVARELIEG